MYFGGGMITMLRMTHQVAEEKEGRKGKIDKGASIYDVHIRGGKESCEK